MRNRAGQRGQDVGLAMRSRLVESLFACAAVLVLCVIVLAVREEGASPGAFAAAVGFGALALAGAWSPRIALALTVLGIFAYYAAGFPPVGMVLPAVGVLYLTASRSRTVWAIGGAATLLAVSTYFRLVDSDPSARFTGYEYVTEIALAAASIALGAAMRSAREQRYQAARIAELVAAEQRHLTEREVQEERMRIARDLHDTVGHQLTVAALHAAVAAEAIGIEIPHADAAETTDRLEGAAWLGEAREALERVRDANTESLRELRAAVRLLRGAESDSDPLGVAALARTAREAGLAVELETEVEATALDPAVLEAAKRILTEAVTNVLRHARASTLRIWVMRDAGMLRLEVADDGVGAHVGFGTDREAPGSGSGLAGVRERAALVGGAFELHSEPGKGTKMRVELPLAARDGGGR